VLTTEHTIITENLLTGTIPDAKESDVDDVGATSGTPASPTKATPGAPITPVSTSMLTLYKHSC